MKNCKDITGLLSDEMERALTWREKLAVRFHLLLCIHCSRFEKHIHFLRKAAKNYPYKKD